MASGNIGILRARIVDDKKLLKAQKRALANMSDPKEKAAQKHLIDKTKNKLKDDKIAYQKAVEIAKKNRRR